MQLEWICSLLFLLGNAIWDIRTRCICLWFTIAFAAEGAALSIMRGRPPGECLSALAPGLLLLALSSLSGGSVGGGDGIALLVLGLFLDVWGVLLTLLAAFFMSSLPSGVLFLFRRCGHDSLPFLPFLLLGCAAALTFGGGIT